MAHAVVTPSPAPGVAFEGFEVTDTMDIFHRKALSTRISRLAWNVFSAIVFPIGLSRMVLNTLNTKLIARIVLFSQNFKKEDFLSHLLLGSKHKKDDYTFEKLPNADYIKIKNADGIVLDTMAYKNVEQRILAAEQQKWIIAFWGNGEIYEQYQEELQQLSVDTGASIYTGNYRGVLASEGFARSSADLVVDGEAMVQYLLQKGVLPENILIYGHSLGGAVATEVVKNHPGMHLCADRTFSTLTDFLIARFKTDITPFARNNYKITITEALKAGTEALKAGRINFIQAGILHCINGLGYIMGTLIGKIIWLAGWRFNSVGNFHRVTGEKFIMHSKEDGVVRYPASLYKRLKDIQMDAAQREEKRQREDIKRQHRIGRVREGYVPGAYAFEQQYDKSYKPETIRIRPEDVRGPREKRNIGCLCHMKFFIRNLKNYQEFLQKVKTILNLQS